MAAEHGVVDSIALEEENREGSGDERDGRDTKEEEANLSFAAGVSLAVNFIMGSGFLAIPFGMNLAGVATGAIVLILATSVLWITATYLLEVMTWAEAIFARGEAYHAQLIAEGGEEETGKQTKRGRTRLDSSPSRSDSPLLAGESGRGGSRGSEGDERDVSPIRPPGGARYGTVDQAPIFALTERKIEIVEMFELFVGTRAKLVYIVCVALYIGGAIWGYSAVFGIALSTHFPLGIGERWTYVIYTLIFASVVITVACFDLREQIGFQMALTVVRIVVFTIMFVTVLVAMGRGGGEEFGSPHAADWGERDVTAPVFFFGSKGVFSISGLARLVPIVVYSQLFHTGAAVLAQPLKNKTNVHKVWGTTYLITTTFYVLASGTVALFFGNKVAESSNILWEGYGTGKEGRMVSAGEMAFQRAIGTIVVLFPAMDVISVTPINIIALASNVMSAVYGEKVSEVERTKRWTTITYRLICGLIPCLGAVISHELATLLDYAGIIGIFICLVLPPFLWELSLRWTLQVWGTSEEAISAQNAPCGGRNNCLPRRGDGCFDKLYYLWNSGQREPLLSQSRRASTSSRTTRQEEGRGDPGGDDEDGEGIEVAHSLGTGGGVELEGGESSSMAGTPALLSWAKRDPPPPSPLPPSHIPVATPTTLPSTSQLPDVITFPNGLRVPRASAAVHFTADSMPASPFTGFWSKLYFARIVLVAGCILAIVIIVAMTGAFGEEGDVKNPEEN